MSVDTFLRDSLDATKAEMTLQGNIEHGDTSCRETRQNRTTNGCFTWSPG